MMNFRERIDTIKKEKLDIVTGYETVMFSIRNQVLGYIASRPKKSFENGEKLEILFAIDTHNRVFGRVHVCDKFDKDANFVAEAKSKEEANLALVFLEHIFKSEDYQILNQTSATRDRCFSVIIKL